MGLSPSPPLYPSTLRPVLDVKRPEGAYAGKKILSIHGKVDNLVPYAQGAEEIEEARIEAQQPGKGGESGSLAVLVLDGVGHQLTTDAIQHTAEWIVRWAISKPVGSNL